MGKCVVTERFQSLDTGRADSSQPLPLPSLIIPHVGHEHYHIENYPLWTKCVNNKHGTRVDCPFWSCLHSVCFKCCGLRVVWGSFFTFLSGSVCFKLEYSVPHKLGITHLCNLCETNNTSHRFLAGRDPVTKDS